MDLGFFLLACKEQEVHSGSIILFSLVSLLIHENVSNTGWSCGQYVLRCWDHWLRDICFVLMCSVLINFKTKTSHRHCWYVMHLLLSWAPDTCLRHL